MRYLDKWNQTKESVQELLNVDPDYVITDRDYIESFVEIEELSKEFLKKEGLCKKGKASNIQISGGRLVVENLSYLLS